MSTYGYRITIFFLLMLVFVLAGVSVFFVYKNNSLERAGESAIVGSKTSNSRDSLSAEILFRTPVAATPIPLAMRGLKSNALTLWSLYIRERYNRTGNPSDNNNVMYVFDIPSRVSCSVGTESYNWLPLRYQSWVISCTEYDNPNSISFLINGTAAEGITGGIYYAVTDPLIINGMGDWPEFCYTVDTSSAAPIHDGLQANNTPAPTGTSSSQKEKK